jgi:hypothetical protein
VTLTLSSKAERLGRDQRLVVIHADGDVVARPRLVMEHRVGGQGPDRIDTLLAQHVDRRADDGLVLRADRPAFAGMRIEAGNGEPRRLAMPKRCFRSAWAIRQVSMISSPVSACGTSRTECGW